MADSLASRLATPISTESPAGADLYESGFYAEIENPRIFGSDTPLPGDLWAGDSGSPGNPIDWRRVRARSIEGLERSRDLRALNLLAAAVVRLEGVNPFLELVSVAAEWLSRFPEHVHPVFEDDGLYQINTLAGLEDRMAILEPLRRSRFVAHRVHGNYSLRDVEIALGRLDPNTKDQETVEQITTAIRASKPEAMLSLLQQTHNALLSLEQIGQITKARTSGKLDVDLGKLEREIKSLRDILRRALPEEPTTHSGNSSTATLAASNPSELQMPGAASNSSTSAGLDCIQSRADARRALDSVIAYFREHEPSSPIPLLAERTKRFIGLSFLELITDVAPDAVAPIRELAGLRNDPSSQGSEDQD